MKKKTPSDHRHYINWLIKKMLKGDQTNGISDGSHTFGDLYYHRAVLFAALLKAYPHQSWRSRVQSDGQGFPGYFLCGVETPEGQYTYHYPEAQWDLFDGIRELPESPTYDGHKPEDVMRVLSLDIDKPAEQSNLYDFAVRELDLFPKDEMQQEMNHDLLQIVAKFSDQGHSGLSASYALGKLTRLLAFEPLKPLTGEDDEWNEYADGRFQNKRCSRVFKNADGTAHDIEAQIVSYDEGKTWHYPKKWKQITFPYTPPSEPKKVLLPAEEEPQDA